MSKVKPKARHSEIVVQEFGDEILIYDLKTNKAYNLNETSALIWQLCDGHQTVSEIARNLTGKFDSIVSEDFVWLSLEELNKENLMVNESVQMSPFQGLSRREMVRKIGVASMIALPVISSLIAPFAVNAASTCFPLTNNANENPNGCPCDTLSDCISVCCSFANPRVCMPDRSGPLLSSACQPCNANCQCPTGYNCPSISGQPRICRSDLDPAPSCHITPPYV